jgi:valyl-tRNA synthetase
MPLTGQRLGVKKKYKYTMDDGTSIRLRLDSTLGDLAGTGLSAVTTADDVQNKPTNFKPRVAYVQFIDTDGRISRKELVCNSDGALYKSNVEQNISIDGASFQTTGRRGEQYSF